MTKVAVLATLDSKNGVARFFCEALRRAGAEPWVMDLSLRPHENGWADISGRDIAAASGSSWKVLSTLPRAEAAETMIGGGTKVLAERIAGGDIGAAVGVGGANGSTMACAMMRALKPLFPKAMVTPVAATAAVQWYVAESDIAMYPTIGDISLNRITRAAMTNAAVAVSAQAKAWLTDHETEATPPLIGVSSFGNLQKCVDRVTARLEAAGNEVIHFHSSGPGGKALERLARLGELAGVIDVTTSELADLINGGVYAPGDDRLTGAGARGLAQVVVPGAIDFTNWWVGEVPARFHGRAFYQYNVEILLMRTDADEMARLATLMADRLNAATGPVSVLIPSQGFSQMTDKNMHDLAGNGLGPWARPDIDAVFVETLKLKLTSGPVKELDLHINDAAFADACVGEFFELNKDAKP